jgi:hypothetical protein
MRRAPIALLALALGAAIGTIARAEDEAKVACKQGCQETLRSCKQDCQVERDSGTAQESYIYRQCDQSCHDDYAACKSECERQ